MYSGLFIKCTGGQAGRKAHLQVIILRQNLNLKKIINTIGLWLKEKCRGFVFNLGTINLNNSWFCKYSVLQFYNEQQEGPYLSILVPLRCTILPGRSDHQSLNKNRKSTNTCRALERTIGLGASTNTWPHFTNDAWLLLYKRYQLLSWTASPC